MAAISGLHITGVERLKNSNQGNPRFDITFIDAEGAVHKFRTVSNSSCAYDVENLATIHAKDIKAMVKVELSRAGLIDVIAEDAPNMLREVDIPQELLRTKDRVKNPQYVGGFKVRVSECCNHWDNSGAFARCRCEQYGCPCKVRRGG